MISPTYKWYILEVGLFHPLILTIDPNFHPAHPSETCPPTSTSPPFTQVEAEGVRVGDRLHAVNGQHVSGLEGDALALELRKRWGGIGEKLGRVFVGFRYT